MEVIEFRKVEKNTLKGFFVVKIPEWGGVVINSISFHQREDQQWVSLPSHSYKDKEGKDKTWPYILYQDKSLNEAFRHKIADCCDAYLKAQGSKGSVTQDPSPSADDMPPF